MVVVTLYHFGDTFCQPVQEHLKSYANGVLGRKIKIQNPSICLFVNKSDVLHICTTLVKISFNRFLLLMGLQEVT